MNEGGADDNSAVFAYSELKPVPGKRLLYRDVFKLFLLQVKSDSDPGKALHNDPIDFLRGNVEEAEELLGDEDVRATLLRVNAERSANPQHRSEVWELGAHGSRIAAGLQYKYDRDMIAEPGEAPPVSERESENDNFAYSELVPEKVPIYQDDFALFLVQVDSETDEGRMLHNDPIGFFRDNIPEVLGGETEVRAMLLRVNAERSANPKHRSEVWLVAPDGSKTAAGLQYKYDRDMVKGDEGAAGS